MGRIVAPYGIKGWVKIQTYTEQQDALLDYAVWWIGKNSNWQEAKVAEAALHNKYLVVRFESYSDRNAAQGLSGWQIGVPRDLFPEADNDEFYWVDLIGVQVINLQDKVLGQVIELIESKAHDLLVVGENKCLIPFVNHVIKHVDLQAKKLIVDWDESK